MSIFLKLSYHSSHTHMPNTMSTHLSDCLTPWYLHLLYLHPYLSTRACMSTRACLPVRVYPCLSIRACLPVRVYPCVSTRACLPVPIYPCLSTRACLPVPVYPCLSTRACLPVPVYLLSPYHRVSSFPPTSPHSSKISLVSSFA